jgi:hypothetical protein
MKCKFLTTACVHIMIFCAAWLGIWLHIERDNYINVCICFIALFTALSILHTGLICCFYEYLYPTFTQTTAIFSRHVWGYYALAHHTENVQHFTTLILSLYFTTHIWSSHGIKISAVKRISINKFVCNHLSLSFQKRCFVIQISWTKWIL